MYGKANLSTSLDSRQRKKQHTERLEDEKKHFTGVISDLEDDLASMKARMDQLILENDKYHHCLENLTMEKDEMIRVHTIETGELRKKVGVLTDHIQRLEINAMPTNVGGSNTMPGSYEHMDMSMGGA